MGMWPPSNLPEVDSRGHSGHLGQIGGGGVKGGADELGGRHQIPPLPHDAVKPHFLTKEKQPL